MVQGKRSAEWDQTAALIVNLRRCFGDKDARFEAFHPDFYKKFYRNQLKSEIRKAKNDGSSNT